MASNAKKKTTMAKLDRERKVRMRRHAKQAKKDARKLGLDNPDYVSGDPLDPDAQVDGEAITAGQDDGFADGAGAASADQTPADADADDAAAADAADAEDGAAAAH
jgi:hypothetical protein